MVGLGEKRLLKDVRVKGAEAVGATGGEVNERDLGWAEEEGIDFVKVAAGAFEDDREGLTEIA
jgi:hypothetical protein